MRTRSELWTYRHCSWVLKFCETGLWACVGNLWNIDVVDSKQEILNMEVYNRYWKCPNIHWWATITRDSKRTSIIAFITVITSPSCQVCSYWQNLDLFEGANMRICKWLRMPFNPVMRTQVSLVPVWHLLFLANIAINHLISHKTYWIRINWTEIYPDNFISHRYAIREGTLTLTKTPSA